VNTIEYEDSLCCDDVEVTIEGELVDTYGGNYTYMDTLFCKTHNRKFVEYLGGRFNGIEELYD